MIVDSITNEALEEFASHAKVQRNEESVQHHDAAQLWLGKLLYTDGVKYFVDDQGGTYWLMDEIAINQMRSKIKVEEFWKNALFIELVGSGYLWEDNKKVRGRPVSAELKPYRIIGYYSVSDF